MPSLAASHSVGRTDPPMNSMVQTGQVMMNVMRDVIYAREQRGYILYQGCHNGEREFLSMYSSNELSVIHCTGHVWMLLVIIYPQCPISCCKRN